MMDESGFRQKKKMQRKSEKGNLILRQFQKKKEIITLKEDILHLEILFPVMLLHVLQKKDAMPVMVSVQPVWQFILILKMLSNDRVKDIIEERYGNLFQMYEKITDQNPYETPMMIYPAIHYTMGGLWVDYELMTTIPGLFAIGEANFSDHGANRLGASALMQGLADGYFVLPYTIQNYLAGEIRTPSMNTAMREFTESEKNVRNKMSMSYFQLRENIALIHFTKDLVK